MPKTICLIQGHPHAIKNHLCHALAERYAEGAEHAGHDVLRIDLADMDIPFFRNPAEFVSPPPKDILAAQEKVKAADHLVIFYPLWLGTMPALVKAFFEQLARNEFAIAETEKDGWPRKMMKGKSARVVVTMGMPVAAYRLFFGAHGVKGFEKAILGISGFKPIRESLIGGVQTLSAKQMEKHFDRMWSYGGGAS